MHSAAESPLPHELKVLLDLASGMYLMCFVTNQKPLDQLLRVGATRMRDSIVSGLSHKEALLVSVGKISSALIPWSGIVAFAKPLSEIRYCGKKKDQVETASMATVASEGHVRLKK